MSNSIVCKFGGSSLANAAQIEKVREIICSDRRRKYVVVSAPGKVSSDEEKITDHLHNIATGGDHFLLHGIDISDGESRKFVMERFYSIVQELGIDGSKILADLEEDLDTTIHGDKKLDFIASRGEHYNAKIIDEYCRLKGMNTRIRLPEDFGFVTSDDFGNAHILPESYSNIRSIPQDDEISIIPGYYGITQNDDIAVLSRGGSDLTAGEIAYAIDAILYENWTDTDGIYEVDPRLIKDARVIPSLTYKEIRLLSSQGFNVFHYDAMVNCRKKNIPIKIKNTNNPAARGTLILNERVPEEGVVGIARLDNVAYIYIEKFMMGETIGVTSSLLEIFYEHGINTYHYPTDKDDISILLDQDDLLGKSNIIKEEIEKRINPDVVEIRYNLTLLSPVGLGIKDHPGILAEAAQAILDRNINAEIVIQGPAQMSFHFGLQSYYGDEGLEALYNKLLK